MTDVSLPEGATQEEWVFMYREYRRGKPNFVFEDPSGNLIGGVRMGSIPIPGGLYLMTVNRSGDQIILYGKPFTPRFIRLHHDSAKVLACQAVDQRFLVEQKARSLAKRAKETGLLREAARLLAPAFRRMDSTTRQAFIRQLTDMLYTEAYEPQK